MFRTVKARVKKITVSSLRFCVLVWNWYSLPNLFDVKVRRKVTELVVFVALIILLFHFLGQLLPITGSVLPEAIGADSWDLFTESLGWIVGAFLLVYAIIVLLRNEVHDTVNIYLVLLVLLFLLDPSVRGAVWFWGSVVLTAPRVINSWKAPIKPMVLFVVVLSLLVLTIGLTFISNNYELNPSLMTELDWCDNFSPSATYWLNCGTPSNRVVAERVLYCNLLPWGITNVSAETSILTSEGFVLGNLNESSSNVEIFIGDHNPDFSFFSFESTEVISFKITGIQGNEPVCLEKNLAYEFMSEEDLQDSKQNFVTYLFALMFITLFTIPKFVIEVARKEKS